MEEMPGADIEGFLVELWPICNAGCGQTRCSVISAVCANKHKVD